MPAMHTYWVGVNVMAKCSVLQVLVAPVCVASPLYSTSQEYVPFALTATVVFVVAAAPLETFLVWSTSAVPEHPVPEYSRNLTVPPPPPVIVAESFGYTDCDVEMPDWIGLTTVVSPESPHEVEDPLLLASPLYTAVQ